jgi:phosphoenolpyruvate-protein kinase (PTS system EI component)
MARQPLAVPLLLGLGIRELSMNLYSIPAVKKMIAKIRISEAEDMAARAMNCDSAEEVKIVSSDKF